MLRYRGHPRWEAADGRLQPVPMTRPGALALVLAARGDWIAREALAALLWPDGAPQEAQHRLRLTLHRCRALLQGWGVADALQAERSRLRLKLPTDLDGMPEAEFLAGYRLPGSDAEGFDAWARETADRLARPTGAAQPARPAAAAPPPLAGREAELQALARLRDGAAAALVLSGEAGIGKSTLLRHAWPGAPWMSGREALQALPYRAIADLLREHGARLRAALNVNRDSPLAAHRLDLARLLPELAPGEALPPLDPMTARARLAEALALAVESLGPWLVVDDLPWCDEASLAVLGLLAHRGRTRWVASARPPAEPSRPDTALLRRLRQAGQLAELALEGLDAAALARALGGRDGTDWPQLARLSGGNPFIAAECLARRTEATPTTVRDLLNSTLQPLPPPVRALAEAAALLGEPAAPASLAGIAGLEAHAGIAALQAAQSARLLVPTDRDHLACRHDLLRQVLLDEMSPGRRGQLHGAVAQWLAGQPGADPLRVGQHFDLAGRPDAAWPWLQRAARQLKQRGEMDAARTLWQRIHRQASDAELVLMAQLELAASDFFDDLAASRIALEAVAVQLPTLPAGPARQRLQARAHAALVDNGVFAGHLALARRHGTALRSLLDTLPDDERVEALEVLIELAMREPDEAECWRLLGELRRLAPQRPQVLSFEGQIHWFTGDIRAALAALRELLQRFPDHRRGLTIDNDIAVMLQALGRLDEAEAAAQASLRHWAGVAHTETLTLMVLGLIHTSAGRADAARRALDQALRLAREQASPGFEAEAAVRRARLGLQEGRLDEADAALAPARDALAASPEPLRVSQWAWVEVRLALARDQAPPAALVARLAALAAASRQPLVQTRWLHVQALVAAAEGDLAAAGSAAARMQALAHEAGVLEAEAWLLQARLAPQDRAQALAAGLAVARRAGFGALQRHAEALAPLDRGPA